MKSLLLTALLLFSTSLSAQTLPNPSFEDVVYDSIYSADMPVGWTTSGFGAGTSTLYKTAGARSLMIWNWYTYAEGYAKNGAGSMFSVMSYADGGTDISAGVSGISGFYRYDTASTATSEDSAQVIVVLKRWNTALGKRDTLAYLTYALYPEAGSIDMVPFFFTFPASPGAVPDSIVVTFVSSNEGLCAMDNCLYLYVDDLNLLITDVDGSVRKEPLTLYPNPTRGDAYFSRIAGKQYVTKVYSLEGKLLAEHTVQGNTIPLAEWGIRSGLYMVELLEDGVSRGFEKMVVE